MRLQLTRLAFACALVSAALVSAAAAPARAQQQTSVRIRNSVYQDDDATFIDTSVLAASAAVSEKVGVDAHGLIDVVSTASVDVVAAATKRWHEVRKEAEGGLSYADGSTTLNGSYIFSDENDWSSNTVNFGVSHDFFVHDLTLGLGGSFVDNHVGRSHDPNFHERLHVYSGTANAVIVGGPNDLWSLAYNLSYLDGYQASPYRYARFRDPSQPDQVLYAGGRSGQPGERMPNTRARHALTLRWNHALFSDTSLRSHMRVYRDDWGVTSLTAGTEYIVGFAPWELAFSVRGYAQHKADFYRDIYPLEMRYMTADRKLSTMYDVFAGPHATLRFGDVGPMSDLRIDLKVNGCGFWFPEYAALPKRFGYVAELGAGGYF